MQSLRAQVDKNLKVNQSVHMDALKNQIATQFHEDICRGKNQQFDHLYPILERMLSLTTFCQSFETLCRRNLGDFLARTSLRRDYSHHPQALQCNEKLFEL
jgi:hypothetical protein